MAHYTSKHDDFSYDIIYNIILAAFVSSLSTTLVTHISLLIKFIFNFMNKICNFVTEFFNSCSGEVVIYGLKIINEEDSSIYFPDSCKSVLYKLKKQDVNLLSVTENYGTEQMGNNFLTFNYLGYARLHSR